MGENDWERARITQGRPAAGTELTEDYNPYEAGLCHAVSLDKGCYIGQETLAKVRLHAQQQICQDSADSSSISTIPSVVYVTSAAVFHSPLSVEQPPVFNPVMYRQSGVVCILIQDVNSLCAISVLHCQLSNTNGVKQQLWTLQSISCHQPNPSLYILSCMLHQLCLVLIVFHSPSSTAVSFFCVQSLNISNLVFLCALSLDVTFLAALKHQRRQAAAVGPAAQLPSHARCSNHSSTSRRL
jgi:folate-binding protein YgfZ